MIHKNPYCKKCKVLKLRSLDVLGTKGAIGMSKAPQGVVVVNPKVSA